MSYQAVGVRVGGPVQASLGHYGGGVLRPTLVGILLTLPLVPELLRLQRRRLHHFLILGRMYSFPPHSPHMPNYVIYLICPCFLVCPSDLSQLHVGNSRLATLGGWYQGPALEHVQLVVRQLLRHEDGTLRWQSPKPRRECVIESFITVQSLQERVRRRLQ